MKINKITKKNGETVYRASVYLGIDAITGKKVKKTISGRTKREVNQKALTAQIDFEKQGQTVFTQAVQVANYAELVELWKENRFPAFKPSTIERYKIELRRYLLPAFGDMKPNKITRPYIQAVVNGWAKAYNSGQGGYKLYRELHTLNKNIFTFGISLGILDVNPCHDVIVPRVKPSAPKKKHFDNDELEKLLDYLGQLPPSYENQYKTTLYKFLLATGCRIGEALALEWSDIDLEKATVTVGNTLQQDGTVTLPKTRKGTRTISIDKKTVLMLRLYKTRHGQHCRAIGSPFAHVVFSNGLREYPSSKTLSEALKKDLSSLGIFGRSFHAFRHSHASLLLNAGIPYKELQTRLGHSTLAMTMDTYSHLSEYNQKTAVTYFEKATADFKSS